MYNIKEVKKEATKIQNNLSTFIIMSLTLIIGILYINRLFCILKVEELQYMNVISFIRLFNLVLAGLAIGSCIMCYNSTKKEELFIISLSIIHFKSSCKTFESIAFELLSFANHTIFFQLSILDDLIMISQFSQ